MLDNQIDLSTSFNKITENLKNKVETNFNKTPNNNFESFLKKAIDQVNKLQSDANSMQKSFENGNTDITLSDVMIASNKAKIALNASIAIRNKLVEAYNSVYNMNI